jgi:hypothetical protein
MATGTTYGVNSSAKLPQPYCTDYSIHILRRAFPKRRKARVQEQLDARVRERASGERAREAVTVPGEGTVTRAGHAR